MWPRLFSTIPPSAGPVQPFQEQDDDVAETLDPTHLRALREALEGYTAVTGKDASGLGLEAWISDLVSGGRTRNQTKTSARLLSAHGWVYVY